MNFAIDRFREGSRKDFQCVYECYYDAMYTFAYNLIRDKAEAQDIATKTFMELWRIHANFESLDSIKAFLYVVNRNACLDFLRSRQKQRLEHKEEFYLIGQERQIMNSTIDQCRAGRMKDFQCVYEAYYDTMYNFAYNLVRNEAEAQDIVSETFMKLWRRQGNFESLDNIKAFLYVVNRNACLDSLRFLEKQRTVHKEVLYLVGQEREKKKEMIDAEVLCELNQKIEGLPPKCQKIFKLIYYNNLSTAEVAEEMGISNQNVLNQKARAIQILRSGLLSKDGGVGQKK